MKKIPLGKKGHTFIDDEDFSSVNQHKWCLMSGRYAGRSVQIGRVRTAVYLHRSIMNCPPGMVVNHIDGDMLNNTRGNLEICTQQTNVVKQRKINTRNTSGHRGITYDGQRNKWVAQTHKNGKHVFVGRYSTKDEAIKAHLEKFIEIHGIAPTTITPL